MLYITFVEAQDMFALKINSLFPDLNEFPNTTNFSQKTYDSFYAVFDINIHVASITQRT